MSVSTALRQRCDPQGAVSLRYRNHKMGRDAVVPIDDELAMLIQDQQARTRQRFPTTGVLLPRISADPDGRLSISHCDFPPPPSTVSESSSYPRMPLCVQAQKRRLVSPGTREPATLHGARRSPPTVPPVQPEN